MRLNIAAGTAVRFEPGDTREVELVAIGGRARGVRAQRPGRTARSTTRRPRAKALERGRRSFADDGSGNVKTLDRRTYADHYGPTTGDRIRLADTDLIIRIERDCDRLRRRGEVRRRQGDPRRHGAVAVGDARRRRARPRHHHRSSIIDSTGIYKADVGIRDGRISAIGKAGNPGIMDGVTPGLEIGASTEILAGEGHILTAGGIDSHVHFISPNQIPDAFHSGITTLIGGGTGPATGTNATTCTPGAWNIRRMYEAVEAFPLNFGFLGKGNASTPEPLREQIRAGAHRPEAARRLGHDAGRDRSAVCRSPTSSTCRWRFTPTR